MLRFDNRDVGLSTSFASRKPEGAEPSSGVSFDPSNAAYTLLDMAGDAAGLLEGARLRPGARRGGLDGGDDRPGAGDRASRTRARALCSIMSTTGDPEVGTPTPEALQVLLAPSPLDREGYIERQLAISKVIGSPGFPFDEARVRRRAGCGLRQELPPRRGGAPGACNRRIPRQNRGTPSPRDPDARHPRRRRSTRRAERGTGHGGCGPRVESHDDSGNGPRPSSRGLARSGRCYRQQCQRWARSYERPALWNQDRRARRNRPRARTRACF